MSTEDEMWRDYDHYINTGELSEYFEYEPYCYDEDIENPYTTQPEEYDYIDHLDDVIRNLKNLKKENERIIKEQKKKESAQKKKHQLKKRQQSRRIYHLLFNKANQNKKMTKMCQQLLSYTL